MEYSEAWCYMRVIRVVMWQCELLRQAEPEAYLGTRFSCDRFIEHLVVSKRSVKRVRLACETCVLAKLARASYLLGHPEVTSDGKIQFLVRDDSGARRILREHQEDLVDVEYLDHRSVYLTPRQREVLKTLAEETTSISSLARRLGVAKPAALRLVKRSLRKLAKLHSP